MSENKPKTDLGTPEIHKRHTTLIRGGAIEKAKVMDQMIFDRMLLEGMITLAQHQACEYVLHQASKAGIYTSGLDWSGAGGGGDNGPKGPRDMIMRFGKTLSIVRRKHGEYASYLVEEVICHNWDITESKDKMKIFKAGLDSIVDRKMVGFDPMRHIKKDRGRKPD